MNIVAGLFRHGDRWFIRGIGPSGAAPLALELAADPLAVREEIPVTDLRGPRGKWRTTLPGVEAIEVAVPAQVLEDTPKMLRVRFSGHDLEGTLVVNKDRKLAFWESVQIGEEAGQGKGKPKGKAKGEAKGAKTRTRTRRRPRKGFRVKWSNGRAVAYFEKEDEANRFAVDPARKADKPEPVEELPADVLPEAPPLPPAILLASSGSHPHPHVDQGKHEHPGLPAGGAHEHEATTFGAHRHQPQDPLEGQHTGAGGVCAGEHEHLQARGLGDLIEWMTDAHWPVHLWLPGHKSTLVRPRGEAAYKPDRREDWREHAMWPTHSTGDVKVCSHLATLVHPLTQLMGVIYQFEDGTSRRATAEDFEAERAWFAANMPAPMRQKLEEAVEIEFTDRYDAMGIPQPDPSTMCRGRCEGTGIVPVCGPHEVKDGQATSFSAEAWTKEDPALKALWEAAEAAHPAEDGWHFVECPDCHGNRLREFKVQGYDPAAVTDEQLCDDWRLVSAKLATMDGGGKTEFESTDQLLAFSEQIVQEILRRITVRRERQRMSAVESSKPSAMTRDQAEAVEKRSPSQYTIGTYRMQTHWRGKSAHLDLRFKAADDYLDGWTIMSEPAGAIKSPVDTMEAAYAEQARVGWKFAPDMDPASKVVAVPKGRQPIEWLNAFNVVYPPGVVGATAEEEGVFSLVDDGKLVKGVQKSDFREYFLDGMIFKGRIGFRLISTKGFAAEDGQEPRERLQWQVSANLKDQTPNILSRTERTRDRAQQYVPAEGERAVPPEWEARIKPEWRWWEKGLDADQRISRLNLAWAALTEKGELPAKAREAEPAAPFLLRKFHWKGQDVVRGLPRFFYSLIWRQGTDLREIRFEDQSDPVGRIADGKAIAATVGTVPAAEAPPGSEKPSDWMDFPEGKPITPGHPLNPNKKLPMFVDRVDAGEVVTLSDEPTIISIRLKGKEMAGQFVIKRPTEKDELWEFSRQEMPGEKVAA